MADRSWTGFSRGSSTSNSSSPPQSSSASVRSLRKRSSLFFGRSRSNAKARQQLSALQPTSEQTDEEPPRPTTAHSTQTAKNRKEPLNAIRNTLLGSRRRSPDDHLRPASDLKGAPTIHNEPPTQASSPQVREEFKTGEQYYRHLRKQSISPPFNFEHRAHTARTQLPPLETVAEQDLKREFWTASAHHRPGKHLHGIQAADIPKQQGYFDAESSRPTTGKSQPVSPLSASEIEDDVPHIPTPIERGSCLDEKIFEKIISDGTTRTDSVRTPPEQETSVRLPRRSVSLNALKMLSDGATNHSGPVITFYESDSSNTSGDGATGIFAELDAQSSPPVEIGSFPVVPIDSPKQEELEFRSTQPLPPVPAQTSIKKYRTNSLRQAETTLGSSTSLRIPNQRAESPASKRSSKRSSRSSRSVRKSPSQASTSEARQSKSLSDTTWEDDVDFIYEQQAESTCDFNWDAAQTARTGSVESSGSTAAAGGAYHAHSPAPEVKSTVVTPMNHSRETIAERRSSRKEGERPRATSVGHRGFLAARHSSQDLASHPNPLHITPNPSHASLLSPVFSVSGADEDTEKTPCTPAILHYPSTTSANSDFLSDPESCRNSGSTGKHRKSSSYGSHESRARPAPSANRETAARWSVASANSLPELAYNRPRSKLILSKTIISKPLETLPQSPPCDFERGLDSPIVPREFQTQPVRQSFVMRRPQSPSDRAVLQGAGRMVQDGGARIEHGSPGSYGVRKMEVNDAGWI